MQNVGDGYALYIYYGYCLLFSRQLVTKTYHSAKLQSKSISCKVIVDLGKLIHDNLIDE